MWEKGVVPLLILLSGLGFVLFIIVASSLPLKNQLSQLYPKKESRAVSDTTGATFSLGVSNLNVVEGDQVPVTVLMRSDTHKANLFSAKINYDKDKLETISIDTTGTFITLWVERVFDNILGRASVVGGVPRPGFSTSGTDATMATLVFKAKSSGMALISYDISSAIYRNNDNVNILTATSGLTLNIQPVSPSPTVTPPAPTPTPSPIPSPTEIPVPTPTPAPVACSLSNASWNSSQNPIDEGAIITLSAIGTGNCIGKQVTFEVREDDGILGFDPVKINPASSSFIADTASTSWVAEYQPDGFDGINDPPEYYFIASLTDGTSTITSAAPQLQVNRLPTTVFKKGDSNKDGSVNLQDLSIMFSYWFDTSGFPDELDINTDGIINTFDFSSMLLILKAEGVLTNPITQ